MDNTYNDMDTLFDGVLHKLTSAEFGKNLAGELPLFIQPYPAECQREEEAQVTRLVSRLQKKGYSALPVNLYSLCMDILEEEGVLESILEGESEIEKEDIVSTLDSVLDIKSAVIPRLSSLIGKNSPQFVFIYGVGHIYPFVRSHGILNNIVELTESSNLVLFFPGEYNNLQLRLFNRISDENYYRGYNLNDIKA